MKKLIVRFSVLCILLIVIALFIKGYLYKDEIANHRKQTICKFIYCKQYPKTTTSFFEYHIDNRTYQNSYGQCPINHAESINKFFLMYYSAIDPNKIEVDFSKEIVDTTTIIQSGFSLH